MSSKQNIRRAVETAVAQGQEPAVRFVRFLHRPQPGNVVGARQHSVYIRDADGEVHKLQWTAIINLGSF